MNDTNYAIVFPGQGCQKPGMGKDFFDNFSESRVVFEEASNALDLDMQELCFTENEKLNLTEFTQPALLTTEIAIFKALKKEFGLVPNFFAGHSLGEYTALVAAEVLPLDAAVKITRKRGALMQSAVPAGVGAMAAIIGENLDFTNIEALCAEAGCEIANFNSSAQVVISGTAVSVALASENIKQKMPQVRIVPLNVSAPFHSKLMKPIEEEFNCVLDSFTASFNIEHAEKVLSNFTGIFHTTETLLDSLVRQISGSVRWVENMQKIAVLEPTVVELGPTRVLGRFFSSVGVEVKAVTDLRTLKRFTL
jgi:[acyl-carrier-protein] S-malonyltransferase